MKNVDEGTLSYAMKALMSFVKAVGVRLWSVADNLRGVVNNLVVKFR
jgi:hypothetical protein